MCMEERKGCVCGGGGEREREWPREKLCLLKAPFDVPFSCFEKGLCDKRLKKREKEREIERERD